MPKTTLEQQRRHSRNPGHHRHYNRAGALKTAASWLPTQATASRLRTLLQRVDGDEGMRQLKTVPSSSRRLSKSGNSCPSGCLAAVV